MIYSIIISALLSYLLGSINTSIIVSKLFGLGDIRKMGSGNAGATNTLRVAGAKAAVLVVIGDALKGIVAVLASTWLCKGLFGAEAALLSPYIAAIMVVIGHIFPLYFGFKGGKGIMTAISVVFILDWHIGLILVCIFAIMILCFNYVSLSSCVSAFVYPFIVYWLHRDNIAFVVSSILIATIAIIKHRTNIVRLINGTESKLFKKK